MSSKAGDETCVPLTPEEHIKYDSNHFLFEEIHQVDMRAIARAYYARWLEEHAP
jgi:hypothetical protein